MAHGAQSTTSLGVQSTTSPGVPRERLDAAGIRRWFGDATRALESAGSEINALNVFPVPDRDTGTNMAVTMRAAAASADEAAGFGVFGVANAAAAGALAAAAGSSGVILACYLRGFADALRGCVDVGGAALAVALAGAADAAYGAVNAPIEGTMLSVARAAALAAQEDVAPDDVVPCAPEEPAACVAAAAAAAGAGAALAETTAQVPALAAAGVVDAGGQGLVVALQALAAVTAGDSPPSSPGVPAGRAVANAAPAWLPFAYEVQYALHAPAAALPVLRTRLDQLGDSVAIVNGGDLHNVHVHVNDVGAAIEASLDLGRPSRIRVTRFGDQIAAGED